MRANIYIFKQGLPEHFHFHSEPEVHVTGHLFINSPEEPIL